MYLHTEETHMKLGVLTNLFGSLPLEEALVKFEKLGETVRKITIEGDNF